MLILLVGILFLTQQINKEKEETLEASNTQSELEAEKEEEGKEKSPKYLRRECRVSCQRSYYVGDDVEVESVKAKYDNGMLELTVPKAAPKQIETRSIAIE